MTPSLEFRLCLWLSMAIILVAAAAGLFSFASVFHEANELQDDQLRQLPALIDHQRSSVPSAGMAEVAVADPESRVVVLRAEPPGAWTPGTELSGLPGDLPDGLQTVTVQDVPWRLFVSTFADGFRIAVGQQTAGRDEIAHHSAVRTLLPFLSLVLILPLLVGYFVRKMLHPLKRMAKDLERRSEQDWDIIADDQVPAEIRPFVIAIRQLLARVAGSVAAERRFVANAAHELRSPLTALSLQAERLDAAEMSEEARTRLAILRTGIRRTRGLLDQLLALARAQQGTDQAPTVSLSLVFRQVLEDLMPLAEAKRMDIGVTTSADIVLRASEMDLTMLVKNLVDNAIRYAPDGGRIDLAAEITPGGAQLRVDDTGPGIPPEERERVFDPFHRLLGTDVIGSGLGLSIVKTIADRIGAEISLGQSDGAGLQVVVTFPANLVLSSSVSGGSRHE